VTVRYWFNADQNPVSTLFFVSYDARNGNAQFNNTAMGLTGTFAAAPPANATLTADSYLELSFGTAAGNLTPLGGAPAQIQAAIHGPGSNGYSDVFNETNDYSFTATQRCSMYAASTTITAYLKGVLVSGCEPGSGTGASTSSSSGGVIDTDAATGSDAPTGVVVDASSGG